MSQYFAEVRSDS